MAVGKVAGQGYNDQISTDNIEEQPVEVEDSQPVQSRKLLEPPLLETLGIAELQNYIAALRAEIIRTEAVIERKSSHRGAAEAVFARR